MPALHCEKHGVCVCFGMCPHALAAMSEGKNMSVTFATQADFDLLWWALCDTCLQKWKKTAEKLRRKNG